MKEQILALRAQGKKYREIIAELGCAKATIAYHCGKGCREKNVERTRKMRSITTLRNRISKKVSSFKRTDILEVRGDVTTSTVIEKFGSHTLCYLTGTPIDLLNDDYHFDHIIPVSKEGTNNLDNLAITTKQANIAKSNLSVEEFISLCESVVKHNREFSSGCE